LAAPPPVARDVNPLQTTPEGSLRLAGARCRHPSGVRIKWLDVAVPGVAGLTALTPG